MWLTSLMSFSYRYPSLIIIDRRYSVLIIAESRFPDYSPSDTRTMKHAHARTGVCPRPRVPSTILSVVGTPHVVSLARGLTGSC